MFIFYVANLFDEQIGYIQEILYIYYSNHDLNLFAAPQRESFIAQTPKLIMIFWPCLAPVQRTTVGSGLACLVRI
jgi:hypothetical protein